MITQEKLLELLSGTSQEYSDEVLEKIKSLNPELWYTGLIARSDYLQGLRIRLLYIKNPISISSFEFVKKAIEADPEIHNIRMALAEAGSFQCKFVFSGDLSTYLGWRKGNWSIFY